MLAQPHDPDPPRASDWWARTRGGARAARGFHFQDTLGGWLCVLMLVQRLDVHSVTPEGQDDLVLTGSFGDHLVQAKSRQPKATPFTADEIAKLLMEGLDRAARYGSAHVTVCLERPVSGAEAAEWGTALADRPSSDPVRARFQSMASGLGWDDTQLSDALRKCGYAVVGWERAEVEAQSLLASHYDLKVLQLAEPLFNAVRQAIATTTDANAPATLSEAHCLTRTDLQDIAAEVLRTTDPSHLAAALEQGLCSPVRFDPAVADPRYYEGVSTQPHHVASGLVVQPEEVLDALYDLLTTRRTVLLVGPSGVGKSARAWSLARHVPIATWYRIDRLEAGDAATISRFARAMRPTERAPVAFVHDHLGLGSTEEFEHLRRHLAGLPHVFLLGTMRYEDVATIVSPHEVALSEVTLDRMTAQTIFDGLAARGLTVCPSWIEAFEECDGLTLEFTHLLTRGQRLGDVISGQIDVRVRDPRRSNELEILALVSQAHAWGVSLHAASVQQHLGLSNREIRSATSRLLREHMITTQDDGRLSGLHALRSRAVAEAVHRVTPPSISSTRKALIVLVDDRDLGTVALGALRDSDHDDAVAEDLAASLRQAPSRRIASALRGVRVADFDRIADEWCRVMAEAGVPPALVDITASLHMIASDVSGLPLHFAIPRALVKLSRSDTQLSIHRRLVELLTPAEILRSLAASSLVSEATELVAALGPLPGAFLEVPADLDLRPLEMALMQAGVDEVAQFIATSNWVDPLLAADMVAAAGGSSALLRRLLDSDRFLVTAEVALQEDVAVARGRLLHVSDRLQATPDQRVRDVARLMLQLLPDCARADVRAELVGGLPMNIQGRDLWVSGLVRRYAISDAEIAWNRTRSLLVQHSLLQQLGHPNRDALVCELLIDAARFLGQLATAWCTSRNRAGEIDAINELRASLGERVDRLVNPVGQVSTEPTEGTFAHSVQGAGIPEVPAADHVHTLVSGIVYNLPDRLQDRDQWASLAAYCGDTLINALRSSTEELMSPSQDLLDAAAQLEHLLQDFHAVLAELAWGDWPPSKVSEFAKAGPYGSALARVARATRNAAERRAREQVNQLVDVASREGLDLEVHLRELSRPDPTNWPPHELAIGVRTEALENWHDAARRVAELIDDHISTGHAPALYYPIIDGFALGKLAQVRISSSWPGTELFASWAAFVEPSAPTAVTDLVILASQAIQEWSALVALHWARQDVDLQPELNDATARLQAALIQLRAQDDEFGVVSELVDALLDQAQDVEVETHGDPATPPGNLAYQISAGAMGSQEDQPAWRTMNALLVVAILCDLSPAKARRFLDQC